MTAALGITLCKNPCYRVSVSLFARVTSVKSPVCRSQYSTAAAPELVRDSKGRQVLTSKENAKFEAYYRAQGVCSEQQWPVMMEAVRRGLPSVFRSGSRTCPTPAEKDSTSACLSNFVSSNVQSDLLPS